MTAEQLKLHLKNQMLSCPSWERGCTVPLCPLDSQTLHVSIWYPSEPICTRHDIPDTGWLKTQRKIAKRIQEDHKDGYFDISRRLRISNRG